LRAGNCVFILVATKPDRTVSGALLAAVRH
jgi:hypothetical protein